jgi:hypothetical protein
VRGSTFFAFNFRRRIVLNIFPFSVRTAQKMSSRTEGARRGISCHLSSDKNREEDGEGTKTEIRRVEMKIPFPFMRKGEILSMLQKLPDSWFLKKFRFSRNSSKHFHFLENFRVHHPTLSLFEKIIPVCANTCPANFC